MYRVDIGLTLLINCCLLFVSAKPYPRIDDGYMQLLSAFGNAKNARDSYLGSLYEQFYNDDNNGISYQDYMDELLREEMINRQVTGEAQENYYDLSNDEDEDFVGPIDFEVEENWPAGDLELGQVVGVAVDREGFPHVFHRADRVWGEQNPMFDEDNKLLTEVVEQGPIKKPTVLKLSFEDGTIVNSWGENRFYLPHGFTIDNDGNRWFTDIALHQVFKFAPDANEPSLVLGKAFEPAKNNEDTERFCKPTDVAVTSFGEFFVSDGYCNSRVVKFTADGKQVLGQVGDGPGDSQFVIPHSIALAEDFNLLCVADREDSRILCYDAGLEEGSEFGGMYVRQYSDPAMGRIYGIEYNPATGLLHVVNGPKENENAFGFSIDLNQDSYSTEVVDEWSPNNQGFRQPHAVAVSPDGNTLYVGEIAPNRIWKFENMADNDIIAEVPVDAEEEEEEEEEEEVEEDKQKVEKGDKQEVEIEDKQEVEKEEEEVNAENKQKEILEDEIVDELQNKKLESHLEKVNPQEN